MDNVNHGLSLRDIIAARDAMESWVDAFEGFEEEADSIPRVRQVIEAFNLVIAEMEGPSKPVLRLVPPIGDPTT